MTTRARNTRQRAAVAAYMQTLESFRTAQQVHEALRAQGESIGLTTVYRNLTAMAEAGQLDSVRTEDGELTYRGCTSGHHHHLVCRECGSARELSHEVLEHFAHEVSTTYGFTDVNHDIEFHGLCPDCSE